MPTAATVKAYNELRQDLVALLDLQRHTAAKEYQYTVLKERQSISGLDYETEEMTLLNSMSPPVTTSKANVYFFSIFFYFFYFFSIFFYFFFYLI